MLYIVLDVYAPLDSSHMLTFSVCDLHERTIAYMYFIVYVHIWSASPHDCFETTMHCQHMFYMVKGIDANDECTESWRCTQSWEYLVATTVCFSCTAMCKHSAKLAVFVKQPHSNQAALSFFQTAQSCNCHAYIHPHTDFHGHVHKQCIHTYTHICMHVDRQTHKHAPIHSYVVSGVRAGK